MKKRLMPATESSLGQRAFVATPKFVLALAALTLVPAGSISYWQGWLLWANISLWCAALTWYFLKHDPALLERRLAGPGAETEPVQQRIQLFASLFVIAIYVVAALDNRFGWSVVPVAFVIAGSMLVFLGFVIVFLVFRENSFASATIELAPDQRVISTGPYALVRHPMYAGALLLFLGVPLALGSWWGLLAVLPVAAGLVARLEHEESHLRGYEEYRQKVRYRLVPGVW